jgi:putative endonuclease
MNWYVYIARARTGKYYTGITNAPEKRLIKHNSGAGSKMAKEQGPFVLQYVSEPFLNRSQAQIREHQIKGWTQVKKEKLIKGEWK